ncbi:predicted protein [Naegleria gruberi]|uniref:Predicted protein n=1 Tax=Naegleria gruberi TaxID=5762 RepID=D2VPX2_NAEGR|nr:uncharacterized protein NAEGRDRAFT_51329 [Naegleria gruberi]EFC41281.1 predicted protein [Naegleria gruberi]|eukprot:XP_002674025.1 predicted protein [Naegleria gruberi strain NEG-M]
MKFTCTDRIHQHNSYSPLQSERFLTVLAGNYLKTLNMDLFEIMFVYLTQSRIGKTFLEYCMGEVGLEQPVSEENDVAAEVVRAWRESSLSVNGYGRFKDKINNTKSIAEKLPSTYKFNQYHATIIPFIKYSLKITPFCSTNITAISPCLALKLLQICVEPGQDLYNKDFFKLWWDDRRVENSKGIITLSRNGCSLKRDILVMLLSPIKLKELFKSQDDQDKEVLAKFIPEIQHIMHNNPANYCSSDLLAMKEILDPSFKSKNQSSNLVSTLIIMNSIINDTSLDTKLKTKYIINMIPRKMRSKLIDTINNTTTTSESNILSLAEQELCEQHNISTRYAYLLGNDRTFYDQLPICWRCNCTTKLNKVSLIDKISLTPFFPNYDIELYNHFKLRYYQHIFDLLHCDERTLEHMLNNTCLNDDRLLEFLVEILPKLVKKHCGQTIYLKLSTSKENGNNNTGDSTKSKKTFSFIDASYVQPITQVYPYFLEALKDKFDEILFEQSANTINRERVLTFVNNTIDSLNQTPNNVTYTPSNESPFNSFFNNLQSGENNTTFSNNENVMQDDENCSSNENDMNIDSQHHCSSQDDEFLENDFLNEDNDEQEDPLFDINGKNVNDREIIQLIHERLGIGNELNPFTKDGNIFKLWGNFQEVQGFLHYNDEQVKQVLKNPSKGIQIQRGVSIFCSFYVEVFEKSPHYLHQMKYHLMDVWRQIDSLKNAMNFINEGLGKYHATDNLVRGRNGGLGSDSRWDLIVQHITEGFLFKNPKLWINLKQVMKARHNFQESKSIFDEELQQSESLLAKNP